MRFERSEFHALLKWKMTSDPFPTDPTSEAVINDMLDDEAEKRGFGSWIDAYHELDLEDY